MILTNDVIVHMLSMLGVVKDIGNAAMVCTKFRDAANDNDALWKEIAIRRYGERVTIATARIYDNNFKQMIKDDNIRGAMPTLQGVWKSSWKYNTPDGQRFYCCLVTSIKLDRLRNKVLIFLDARGERDLRSPRTSGIWIRETSNNDNVQQHLTSLIDNRRLSADVRIHNPDNVTLLNYRSYSFPQRRGCHKGVLEIDAWLFTIPGSYHFCYANAIPDKYRGLFPDYDECMLFELKQGQTLMDVLSSSFTLNEETPFDGDTPQTEQERWAEHLYTPGSHLI